MSKGRTDWRTPVSFFEKLDKQFGFEYDAAADHSNHLCDIYSTTEGTYYCTMDGILPILDSEDGLHFDWAGLTIWCNPPYDFIKPWVVKAHKSAKENATVVMLLPASIDTSWFHKYIYDRRFNRARENVDYWFEKGRIKFGLPEGEEPKSQPSGGNMVVVFYPPEEAA